MASANRVDIVVKCDLFAINLQQNSAKTGWFCYLLNRYFYQSSTSLSLTVISAAKHKKFNLESPLFIIESVYCWSILSLSRK